MLALAMPSFQSSQGSPPTPAVEVPPTPAGDIDRARAYKSRNKRPCDHCRYKKAACHLESAPPCELCIRYNKECTFVESPAKRRRPHEGRKTGESMFKQVPGGSVEQGQHRHHGDGGGGMPSLDIPQELLPWENGINPFHLSEIPGMNGAGITPHFPFDPALYHGPIAFDTFEPMSASTTTVNTVDQNYPSQSYRQSSSVETTSPSSQSVTLASTLHLPFDSTSGEPSLDRQNSSNAQMVGMSGESDPYLLSRYRYDDHNEAAFQSARLRKMSAGPGENEDDHATIPTFFAIQHNALASRSQRPDRSETNERWTRELEELVNDETGKRLIRLFYKYVQPYLPLLSREGDEGDSNGPRDPREWPPCVLAAIYGHALPFYTWDEKLCVEVYTPPSAEMLFKLSWRSCQPLLHTPTIAVLQTLLLLVQRRPGNRHVSDTPFKWVLMTTAVSIAQALGLNRDPLDWPIPSWEIKQRRRLAWAVYVQDKWLALNYGRASHIQADDWDVLPLTEDDFPEADRRYDEDHKSHFSCHHFIKLCELTVIVDDILRQLYSLKATRQLHTSLEATLEVAKPLRIRLTEWYHALPPGLLPQPPSTSASSSASPDSSQRRSVPLELNGHGSLQLAYITAKIELFRAMLRPRPSDTKLAAFHALRIGALAVAKEMTEFLESLNACELEAFWASYARTNFTIASSFMLLLFVTSPALSDATECLALLNVWRSLLRIKSRSCDLLNLALLKLDDVFVSGMDQLIELSPAAHLAWKEAGK